MLLFFLLILENYFGKLYIHIIYISLIIASGLHVKLLEFREYSLRVFMNLQEGGYNKSTGRSIVYQTSFNEILEHPLGVGSGNFDVYSDKREFLLNKKIYHPHNLFLEIFVEFGLFSFILFCLYIFFSIKISYTKNLKFVNNYGNLLFYTFRFFLLNSMISGDLND